MKRLVSVFYKPFLETADLNERARLYALERGIEYEWVKINPFDQDKVIRALASADAGIIDVEPYDREILSRINGRNRLLIRYGVGYDAVNLEDARACNIHIARTQGANANAVAEMALTMILALKRKLLQSALDGKNAWAPLIGAELAGSTVGILGFGAVGKTLARRLQGFDCKLLAYDTYHDTQAAAALGVEFADLNTVLSQSDAVSVHLALTEQTRGIIYREHLAQMKPTAVLVNTARGGLVNDQDLLAALKAGVIAGAGLDVFTVEPLPAESEYRSLENVILTPHSASATFEAYWKMYHAAVDIAANFFQNGTDERLLV